MKTSYINKLTERLSFPEEAIGFLAFEAEKINANNTAKILMEDALRAFETTAYSYSGMDARFDGVASVCGVNAYTCAMLMLLEACETLEKNYEEKGYTESLFIDTMSDLRFKLIECKNVKGVWGTFVGSWYPGFFRMTRFALGRFQYEKKEFPYNWVGIGGNFIKNGETVLNFHIPSSGVSLTEEVRFDSYRKAKEFFFPKSDKPVPFYCSSWLLFPDYENALNPKSNLMAFRHDFTIVDASVSDSFSNAWRVFGAYGDKPVEEWPRKTSQQRAFAEHTEKGGKHGHGYGLFFFDGEKVVK